jgi:hypothetical protein
MNTYRVGFAAVNSTGRMSRTYTAYSEEDALIQAHNDETVDYGVWGIWWVAEYK